MTSGQMLLPAPPDMTMPRVVTALRAFARLGAFVPIIIAVLVLIGWAANIEPLKRIVPGLVAMNPATAVSFIFLGLSLSILAREGSAPRWRSVAIALGLAAAAVGAIKILALVTPIDLGIDRLLFTRKLAGSDRGLPNQMAPNTAFNFLLLGLGLAGIDRRVRGQWWPAQLLTAIAAMASLLALMGYAYGVRSFYGIGAYIPMAVNTAASFLLIAIGTLCARPTRGIMAVYSSNSSGGVLIRRLLPAILFLPAVLGWLRLAGERLRLFDTDFGLWLLVVLIMTVFTGLVAWNGNLLFRSDLDRAHAERTLFHQATHDALTQLPNRRFFTDQLEKELVRNKETGARTAVLFLDLDLFKVINDSLGHVVGDELLVSAGRRIEQSLGRPGMVARLSGDEFTVMLPEVSGNEEAIKAADRIKRAFAVPFTLGQHEVYTTASIGIAFSEPNETSLNLVRHADIAMYRAKARGKARYELFDRTMDAAAIKRLEVEIELRRALDRGELCLYYQPEVEIESGRLVGVEALVRWNHPERGLLQPADFLPVAEETGLILPIGRWALFEACRQVKKWQEKYRDNLALMISVNLSGKHFQQATLVDEVSDVLKRTAMNPSHLILEITETVAMQGAESSIQILTKLKTLGVLLAIDDFGTGFSSLAYLKRFPVDLLKIDKSFVDGVALNSHDTAIVRAIIALGHALGMKVIAEGVETTAQVEQLRALGSEIGQGFYFAEPLSDDSQNGIPALLAEKLRWDVAKKL